MENAYTQTTSEVLKYFSVSETQGLTEAQIKASREKHGRNGKSRNLFAPRAIAQNLTLLQPSQKTLLPPSGSLSSNNSKISSLSFCSDRPPFLLFWLFSRKMVAGRLL
jgi:hypothetical protein